MRFENEAKFTIPWDILGLLGTVMVTYLILTGA
jgi:hypothetical protein